MAFHAARRTFQRRSSTSPWSGRRSRRRRRCSSDADRSRRQATSKLDCNAESRANGADPPVQPRMCRLPGVSTPFQGTQRGSEMRLVVYGGFRTRASNHRLAAADRAPAGRRGSPADEAAVEERSMPVQKPAASLSRNTVGPTISSRGAVGPRHVGLEALDLLGDLGPGIHRRRGVAGADAVDADGRAAHSIARLLERWTTAALDAL